MLLYLVLFSVFHFDIHELAHILSHQIYGIFQLNSGQKDHVIRPVLVNTLSWARRQVVAIPDELWECLSTEEKSSAKTQRSKEGRTLGKICRKFWIVNMNILNASFYWCQFLKSCFFYFLLYLNAVKFWFLALWKHSWTFCCFRPGQYMALTLPAYLNLTKILNILHTH